MRQVEPGGDKFQPLGPPVREVREVPPPAPKPTATPGVVEMPDGKMRTNLPLPPKLVHDSMCYKATIASKHADIAVFDDLEPAPEPRQVKVGDWVRIVSGQRSIPKINEMVGDVFQVTHVDSDAIRVNGWSFSHPGMNHFDGQLWTAFAEAPR